MKAKKIKIRIKTEKFSIPIPALRFSTMKWITRMAFKYTPSKMRENWVNHSGDNHSEFLSKITPEDIEMILDELEHEEPFKIVDIDTFDENDEKVRVEIYTV